MTSYTVTGVRKVTAPDGSHRHIEGVCTTANLHYTRQQVVDSIQNGDTWTTSCDGYSATVRVVTFCHAKNCLTTPYIQTKPDSTTKDNLENLPAC